MDTANKKSNSSRLTDEQIEYVIQMRKLGFDYNPIYNSDGSLDGWSWIRKKPTDDNTEYNYLTREKMTEDAIEAFRNYYRTAKPAPGTSYNGISIDGYNMYAKWDLWRGGYVNELGYVSAPSSSSYGASLYLNSWYAQGGESTPLQETKFYNLQLSHTWSGGYVSNWGYVSQERKVLGTTTSIWFYTSPSSSDVVLANLINFHIQIDSQQVDINIMKKQFSSYWNQSKNTYDIDSEAIVRYFESFCYPVSTSSIQEALKKHYVVLLRKVRNSKVVDGKTLLYGDDYLIIGYNQVLQTYMYFDAKTGKLGSLDALPIDKGTIQTVKFIYQRRN